MTWTAPNKGVTSTGDLNNTWKASANNGRKAQGLSVVNEFLDVSALCHSEHLVARKGARGAAPAKTVNIRPHIFSEVTGAALIPKATNPGGVQETQPTMANTTWVMTSASRNGNFRSK